MRWCCIKIPQLGLMVILAVNSGVAFATEPAGGEVSSPASDWIVGYIDLIRWVGYNVSVAVDPESGHSYISYYEGIDGDLWLARTGAPVGNCGPGNTWECQVIDAALVVGKYSSIAVGGPGPVAKLYISYYDETNGSLRVFEGTVDRRTGALAGHDSIVDRGDPGGGILAGEGTSIVVDSSGNPHVGYRVIDGIDRIVRYAKKVAPGTGNCGQDSEWECNNVTYGIIGEFFDIELSPGEIPNIAFNMVPDGYDHKLGVAAFVGSGGNCTASQWRCDAIWRLGFDLGDYVSLAIGEDGVKHLAYRNATSETVEWARYVGSGGNCGNGMGDDSYQCDSIDYIGPGGSPSGIALATNGNGHPIIAYQDVEAGYGDLKIARPQEAVPWSPTGNCGPLSPTFFRTWLCETLDAGDPQKTNAHGGLSMAMTSHGEAVVAYRTFFDPPIGPSYGYLKVATEPRIIFADDFEAGDFSAWSATSP